MLAEPIQIVFDGPPSHEAGRFVEVEQGGRSINFGEWKEREDGFWVLELPEVYGEKEEIVKILKDIAHGMYPSEIMNLIDDGSVVDFRGEAIPWLQKRAREGLSCLGVPGYAEMRVEK